MFPMKEKPPTTERAEPRRGEAASEDGEREHERPRSGTRPRIRELAERHRETLDYLSKN